MAAFVPFASAGTLPVNLAHLLDEIRLAPEDETMYVHQTTGQLYAVASEDVTLLGEMHDDLWSDAEIVFMDELREVLMSAQWVALPSGVDEAIAILQFCATLPEGPDRNSLQARLQKSPGFSQGVLDFLDQMDWIEAWERFQVKALAEAIAIQLKAHQIPYV